MGYTPVELRHIRVARRPFGYHRAGVQQILNDVADSFETVWRDRGELADKVELLEAQIEELKGREQVLTNTLVAAERISEEMKERAKREAELIVAEAHGEAREIMRSGQSERERLFAEVSRIETLLRSALGVVVEVGEPAATAAREQPGAGQPAPGPEAKQEPKPDDGRELRPVGALPPRPEPIELQAATAPEHEQDGAAAPDDEDEQPGWPPLRKVAERGADFDWGD